MLIDSCLAEKGRRKVREYKNPDFRDESWRNLFNELKIEDNKDHCVVLEISLENSKLRSCGMKDSRRVLWICRVGRRVG